MSTLPKIVGVLNVTPDSFSDGGQFFDVKKAIQHGLQLIEAGADWLDIGGESTRPGAESVSVEEELRRVLPVIEYFSAHTATPLSIDTLKAEVAKQAIAAGARMINDVSGLTWDPAMAPLAAQANVFVVINHMQGTPKTMQAAPHYDDPVQEILAGLRQRIEQGLRAGIAQDKIIVDPGIGFGKLVKDNLAILKRLQEFKSLGFPIYIGTSRKSFIGKILDNRPVEQRIFGTAATVACAVLGGASYIRVHEPAEMRDVARVAYAVATAP